MAADYARQGVDVPPERIVLTASTSEAYSLLFKLLCDAGDEVLVPRPSYPLFEHLTRLDLVVPTALRPRVPRALVDRLRERRARDHAADARACSSSARTTRPARSSHATSSTRLAAICAPRGIAIIADEVFADYELEAGAVAPRGPRRSRARDVLSFSARRAVEVGRAAAGEARLDRRRRARPRSSAEALRAARARLRHLSVGRRRRCRSRPAELLRARRRRPRRRSRRACAANYRALQAGRRRPRRRATA